jgi:hypothetical protein
MRCKNPGVASHERGRSRWLDDSGTVWAPVAAGDWFDGTTDDHVGEASSCIAYSGPFHVDEEARTLTHSMFVSLFPNWAGQTQPGVSSSAATRCGWDSLADTLGGQDRHIDADLGTRRAAVEGTDR